MSPSSHDAFDDHAASTPPPIDPDQFAHDTFGELPTSGIAATAVEEATPQVEKKPSIDARTPSNVIDSAKHMFSGLCYDVRSANKVRIDGHTSLATFRSLIEAIDRYPFRADEKDTQLRRALSCFRGNGISQYLIPLINLSSVGKKVKYIVAARINFEEEDIAASEEKENSDVSDTARSDLGNVSLAMEQAMQNLPWDAKDILIVTLPDRIFDTLQEYTFDEGKRGRYLQVVDPTKNPQVLALDLINLLIEMPGSDLHLNYLPTGEMVPKIRKDGTMMPIRITGGEAIKLDHSKGDSLIAIFQRLAQLDLANKHKNQDGEISLAEPGFFDEHADVFGHADESMKELLQQYSLRVAYAKTVTGGKLTLRLSAPRSSSHEDLSTSGLSPHVTSILEQKIQEPSGLIIVSGPTGSGKTTTLSKALVQLNDGERHICTVEDPVEVKIPGATQLQIGSFKNGDNKPGSFADGLRYLLRHDPDAILVGETRDLLTAEMSVASAMTGHIVFTTLHANDAIEAITTRFAGFRDGNAVIDKAALYSAIQLSFAQRLVRRTCDDCATTENASELFKEICALGNVELPQCDLRFPVATGEIAGSDCPSCFGKGYDTRVPIAEWLNVDSNVRDELGKGVSPESFRESIIRHGNYKPFAWDGYRLVLSGKSDLKEVVSKLGLQTMAREAGTLVEMIKVLQDEKAVAKSVRKLFPMRNAQSLKKLTTAERSEVISDMLSDFISAWRGGAEKG